MPDAVIPAEGSEAVIPAEGSEAVIPAKAGIHFAFRS
jgi:hypothetical protein